MVREEATASGNGRLEEEAVDCNEAAGTERPGLKTGGALAVGAVKASVRRSDAGNNAELEEVAPRGAESACLGGLAGEGRESPREAHG